MAKGQHFTPYQKGVVKRYYENRESISAQKLGEIVSELYLCENKKKADRLWKSARTALTNAGANKVEIEKLCADRNIERLAKLAGDLF
jgi:hypothetical protein